MVKVETLEIEVMLSEEGTDIYTEEGQFFLPGIDRDELLDWCLIHGQEGIDYHYVPEEFDHGYEMVPVLDTDNQEENLKRCALQLIEEWKEV